MIYLDTHVVVWLRAGILDKLPGPARQQLEAHSWRISPMVQLELDYLHEIGRIREGGQPVVDALRRTVGLAVCEAPFPEVARLAGSLRWTRDPFDRLITAHALGHTAPLVTADAMIRSHYPHAVWD